MSTQIYYGKTQIVKRAKLEGAFLGDTRFQLEVAEALEFVPARIFVGLLRSCVYLQVAEASHFLAQDIEGRNVIALHIDDCSSEQRIYIILYQTAHDVLERISPLEWRKDDLKVLKGQLRHDEERTNGLVIDWLSEFTENCPERKDEVKFILRYMTMSFSIGDIRSELA